MPHTSAPHRMRTPLLAEGLVVAVGIGAILAAVYLGVGTLRSPGPGLWPLVTAVVFTGTSVAILIESLRKKDASAAPLKDPEQRRGTKRVLVGCGLIAAFVLAFTYLGLIASVALLFVAWLRLLGDTSWRSTLVYAGVFTLLFHFVFNIMLQVKFPPTVFSLL